MYSVMIIKGGIKTNSNLYSGNFKHPLLTSMAYLSRLRLISHPFKNSYTYPIPIPVGIPMGISIPTAALAVVPWQVVRPSVRPSVCLVTFGYCDHIGWNSWKIILQLISQPSLSSICRPQVPNVMDLLQRERPILVGIGVGYGKIVSGHTKPAISPKRLKSESYY